MFKGMSFIATCLVCFIKLPLSWYPQMWS